LGLQCNMNCSYCYLQSFLNTPYLTIYSNLDEALKELKEMADTYPALPYRVGTGETIDSLSLDPITHYSRELISFFRNYPHWKVEFKTKSNFVDQFLDVEHAGNVIVSWSINPQAIVDSEEHGTASLLDRLQAARKCLSKGFLVALHMDPMIWRPDWKEHYGDLVDKICTHFAPEELLNISLGTLRFQPEQRHIMRERFSFDSWVLRAEMHRSTDGKMRYDQSMREEMFKFVMDKFKSHSTAWRVFLCMESPETWIASTETVPARSESLKTLFKQLPQHA
jgi:spore photoproduct lyase